MSKPNITIDNVITCVIYALIGLLLVFLKSGALGYVMTALGVLFIVVGVMDIVKTKNLTKGLVEIGIGVVIIVCGWTITEILLLVLGVLLVIVGVLGIVQNAKAGLKALLSPIVTVVIGSLLIVATWQLMDVLCIVAGVIFILNGVLALFGKSVSLQK